MRQSNLGGTEEACAPKEEGRGLRRLLVSVCLLLPLLILDIWYLLPLPLPDVFRTDAGSCLLTALQFVLASVVLIVNRFCFISGGQALIRRKPNVDTLVALAAGLAFAAGCVSFVLSVLTALLPQRIVPAAEGFRTLYFESAAVLLTLVALGNELEQRAEARGLAAAEAPLACLPEMVSVLRGGLEERLPLAQLVPGDVVLVSPGERIPADGVLLSGSGNVDESIRKGESAPGWKQPGDRLSAATLNLEAPLQLRVERVGEDTTLAQLVRLAKEAGTSMTPVAHLAERVAGALIPLAMALALLTFLAWMFLDGRVHFALSSAIAVLVMACPCALGLAVPLTLHAGLSRGVELGVLFRSALALEQLQRVGAVVLDKTGTLTGGKPLVTKLVPIAGISDQLLLTLACSLEAGSEHPLGRAILAYGAQRGIQARPMDGISAVPGKGVVAENHGVSYCAGSLQLLQEQRIPVPAAFEALMQGGSQTVYLAADGHCIGAVVLTDPLRPTAKEAVALLHQSGLQTFLLTGDHRKTAEAIADELGIDSVLAEVLPQQREQLLAQLGGKQSLVAMVSEESGESALQQADLGIVIGLNADGSLKTADVMLMGEDLRLLDTAIRLSRTVLRKIRENLFWACVFNGVGVPLAAGVFYPLSGWRLNPLFSAAAMSLSCVCVAANALRLRRFGRKNAK